MRCPTLKDLPLPPQGKTGWPWTDESPQLPDTMPDGSTWPRISIVTPSLNQGRFIEETIRSVLLQGYPDIEYFIIDGGSSDDSLDIIEKYDPWISFWVSECDCGQSDAINKGIKRSTGEIIAWLNSDDTYTPASLARVAEARHRKTDREEVILFGLCEFVDESGRYLFHSPGGKFRRMDLLQYWKAYFIPQPSVFIPGQIFRENLLDDTLHYVMDWDLWLRLSRKYRFDYLDATLSRFKFHSNSKWGISQENFISEQKRRFHAHHANFLLKVLFYVGYCKWKIRGFYHNILRIWGLKILRLCLGDESYEKLRDFKKRQFPSLSKFR